MHLPSPIAALVEVLSAKHVIEFNPNNLEGVPRCVVNTVTIRSLRILVAVQTVADLFNRKLLFRMK
jgi:hypothetical protein